MNQTGKDIWVGAQGNPLPFNGGFALPAGTQKKVTVATGSSAVRFWGRTGCKFDANGNGTCETGDCARGLYCNGAGGIPPVTLVEFTFDAANAGYQDFYDISLVDGYNLPIRIIPVPGTYTLPAGANKYSCGIAGCTSDLNLTCPPELQVKNSAGQVVSCMSACMKFNTSQYCCTGPNGTPATCPPTNYSNLFKAACPDAYSYAYDDQSSTYICKNASYQIIFGTGGSTQPNVATMYKDCNYGGYAIGLPVGDYTLSQLRARGIVNDDISSLAVNSGYEVQLFEHDNYQGKTITINSNNSCLVGAGWNDIVSSLKVRATTSNFNITIQAENYNNMAGVQTETCYDSGGGQDVGWIDAGDWMAYNNINFPTSGLYKIEYRVASPSGSKLSADLNAGTIQLGSVSIPATGGWQNWTTVSHTVNINAGTYNFGVFAQASGWNINWIRITKVSAAKMASLVQEDNIAMSFETYPNPVANELYVTSSYGVDGSQISIVNSLGHEVIHVNSPSEKIDVSQLSAGIYTIIFKKGEEVVVKRFVKV